MRLLEHARTFAIVAGIGLAGGGVGAAIASIPDPDGTIHGCVNNRAAGVLRIIDPSTGATCGASETPLTFHQQGPRGLPGPKGEKGDPGPAGASFFLRVLANGEVKTSSHPVRVERADRGHYIVAFEDPAPIAELDKCALIASLDYGGVAGLPAQLSLERIGGSDEGFWVYSFVDGTGQRQDADFSVAAFCTP